MAPIETALPPNRCGTDTVNRLDHTAEAGDGSGFFGPTGARRSTTVVHLLAFVRPTAPRVAVLEHAPLPVAQALRERVGRLRDRLVRHEYLGARKYVDIAREKSGLDHFESLRWCIRAVMRI